MKNSKNLYIFLAVVSNLFLFLFLSFFFALGTSTRALENQYITLNTINKVRTGILNMETGSRGYLLTKDPSFLDPYYRGRRDLAFNTELLRSLIRDNSTEVSRLEDIEVKRGQWMRYTDAVVEDMRTGALPDSLKFSKARRDVFEKIRKDITFLEAREEADVLIEKNKQSLFERLILIIIAISVAMSSHHMYNLIINIEKLKSENRRLKNN